MKKITAFLVVALVAWAAGVAVLDSAELSWEPKRVNKAIELLEAGQPIYYTSGHGGYEEGKKMAQTWADYINYDMEHHPYDITQLQAFMRGLADGGPTKSGHRTPAVIPVLPLDGLSEAAVHANAWMMKQVLATGVHGILLTHARDPEAVREFVRASRYPFHKQAVGKGLKEGLRGNGGQGTAAKIWGISVSDYFKKADTWPLNPDGELLLGLKIEDRHALPNAEASTKIPGIGFAEWGPGDMGMSFGYPDRHDPPYPKEMAAARARVMAACKAANIAFLNTLRPNNVIEMLDEGVMIGSGGGPEAAAKGRKHTKRKMPW